MTDQALEVSNDTHSTLAEDVNKEAVQNEIEAPKEASTTEEAKAEEPKAEPTEAEKVRSAMQKRIDRQTAANKAQEERLNQLQREVEALRVSTPRDDGAPKQDDFRTYDEWEQVTIDWKADQRVQERLKAEKEQELRTAQERKQVEARRGFEEKEKAFRTTAPDYDRVAADAVSELNTLAQSGVNIAPLRDMVMTFDNPPEILYQLGKDPTLIEDLVRMEPTKAMRELVKLELALSGAARSAQKRAPEPITGITAKGGGSKSLADMDAKAVLDWAKGKR